MQLACKSYALGTYLLVIINKRVTMKYRYRAASACVLIIDNRCFEIIKLDILISTIDLIFYNLLLIVYFISEIKLLKIFRQTLNTYENELSSLI